MYEPEIPDTGLRVLVVGDLHANTGAALGVIEHAAARGTDVILQAGDFGWWPREEYGRGYLRGGLPDVLQRPDNHATTYDDLVRVDRGRYKLRE